MHPVNYLFEDIYRNYWGIPQDPGRAPERQRAPHHNCRQTVAKDRRG